MSLYWKYKYFVSKVMELQLITLHNSWKLFFLVFSVTFSTPEMLLCWNYSNKNKLEAILCVYLLY